MSLDGVKLLLHLLLVIVQGCVVETTLLRDSLVVFSSIGDCGVGDGLVSHG